MAKLVKRTTEIPQKKKRKKIKSSDKKRLRKKNKVIKQLEKELLDLRKENVKLKKRLRKKWKAIQESHVIRESTSVRNENISLEMRVKSLENISLEMRVKSLEKELKKNEEESETIFYLQRELDDLRTGKIYKAYDMYRLWKTLLKYWFSKPGNKVYVVTPFLDKDRLVDVYKCSESQRGELAAFCVRKKCFYDKTLEDIKTEVRNMSFVDTHLQKFNNFIDNITGSSLYFHCKFIACVHSETAEVLLTSANFTYHHFAVDNEDSVIYSTMTKNEFQSRYLHPILLDI